MKIETIRISSCSPLGPPLVVTESHNNEIHRIAGRRATDQLRTISKNAPLEIDHDSIEIGILNDHPSTDYRNEDSLVRPIIWIDLVTGAITTTQHVPVSTIVTFEKRSQIIANTRPRKTLSTMQGKAAIKFTSDDHACNYLGNRSSSARLIEEALGPIPMIWIFVLGEFGQINNDNAVHNFMDTTVLFN